MTQTSLTAASLNSQQEDDIRKAAKKMGIEVDFNRVKTFEVKKMKLSDESLHRLYVISVEKGVVGALQDFYQTWAQPDLQIPRTITSQQLQGALQEAVITSKEPKLLISEPGKVRVMSLQPVDTSK